MIGFGFNRNSAAGSVTAIQLGLQDGGGNFNVVRGTYDITANTPFFYVMKVVTHTNGVVDIYGNLYNCTTDTLPTEEPTTWELSVSATGLTGDNASTYNYAFFRAMTRSGTGYWDELRIGTTWGDVAKVPEPSTLALLVGGLVGLLAYAWRKRK